MATLKITPVTFDEITEGDLIVHILRANTYTNVFQVWLGIAEEKTRFDEWYTSSRRYTQMELDENALPSEIPVDFDVLSSRSGVIVAARWHEEKEGSYVFRAVEQGSKTEITAPLSRDEALARADEDGYVTVRVSVPQEAYMVNYAGGEHVDVCHEIAFAFGVPYAAEAKIVAVDGDNFIVDYTTMIAEDM